HVHVEADLAAEVVVELGFVLDRVDETEVEHRREVRPHRPQRGHLALRRVIDPARDIGRIALGAFVPGAAQRTADETSRERAAEGHEELDPARIAVLARQLPERVVRNHRAEAVTDKEHALVGAPRLPQHGLQQAANLTRYAVLVAEVAQHLAHREPQLGTRDEAAEEGQRIADEMPQALDAPGRRIDLPQVLLARLGLLQQAVYARYVERDVAIAAVE